MMPWNFIMGKKVLQDQANPIIKMCSAIFF